MISRYTKWTGLREVSFWLAAVPFAFPIYLLISLSFKPPSEAARSAMGVPTRPTFDNYTTAWSQAGAGSVSFAQASFNSCFVTVVVVLLLVVIGAPAGYAIARRGSRLSGALFSLFALGLILPTQLGLIPLYVFITRLDLAGTLTGLILTYLGLLGPFSVFLYTNFFRSLPIAYEEAAQVDGASSMRAFVQIVLPLVRPVTGAVVILSGLLVWKDFLHPLVFVGGTDNATLPVAIHSFVGEFYTEWNLVFASIVIALAPILVVYIFMQRYILKGFTSAVRG